MPFHFKTIGSFAKGHAGSGAITKVNVGDGLNDERLHSGREKFPSRKQRPENQITRNAAFAQTNLGSGLCLNWKSGFGNEKRKRDKERTVAFFSSWLLRFGCQLDASILVLFAAFCS